MKRCLFFVISVMFALVFASGCTKVVTVTQSNVYEINVTFSNAADKQTVAESYTGLQGKINSSDAILVYVYLGNTSGENIWMPLPAHVDTKFYDYAYTDNGIFVFTADAGEGYTWTGNITLKYRVIQIPETVTASKSMNEVENTDYNAIMKEFELYNAPVIRK